MRTQDVSATTRNDPHHRPTSAFFSRATPLYAISFIALVIVIVGFIWHDLRTEYHATVARWDVQLSGSADDRVKVGALWLKERRTDTLAVAANLGIIQLLSVGGSNVKLPEIRQEVERSIAHIAAVNGFLGGAVGDRDCRIVAQSGLRPEMVRGIQEACQAAEQAGEFRVDTSSVGQGQDHVWLNLSAPVMAKGQSSSPVEPPSQIVGSVIMVTENWRDIFPIFASESIPTPASETLIVWRKGDTAFIFSPRLNAQGVESFFQRPLTGSSFESRVALDGDVPFGQFNDYQGRRVFGVAQRIGVPNYSLARKVDCDAALAEQRRRAVLEELVGALSVLLIGIVMVALHRNAAAHDWKERLRQEEALHESQVLTKAIVDSTSDMIWSVDPESFRLLTFNRGLGDYYLHQRGIRLQTGLRQEELFTDPSYINLWRGFYQRALSEGSFTTEYRVSVGTNILQLTFNLLKRDGIVFGISVFGKDITERKHFERAMQEKTDELKEAQRLARVGSWTWDLQTDTVNWSDALHLITGNDPGQPIGGFKGLEQFHSAESWKRLQAVVQRACQDGTPFEIEAERIFPDGRRQWRTIHGEAQRDASGRIVKLRGTAQDITERKRIELALRDSEQRYQDFIEHSKEGVWRLEFDQPIPIDLPQVEILERALRYGYVAECNLAYARDIGFATPEEIAGKHLGELFLPSDEGRWESYRASVGGGLMARTVEFRSRGRSDNFRHFLRTEIPIVHNGMLVRLWGITRDITELRKAETSLRESEERFRATFENAGVGMALVDLQGHPFKSNPALRQMLGYGEEELSRMDFTQFTHPDDRELDWRLYGELVAGQRDKYEIEKRYLKKDGNVMWGQLTVSLVKDRHGRPAHCVGMVQDITERKRAEEELAMLKRSIDLHYDGAYWTDTDNRFIYVNDAACKALGYEREELIGKTILDVNPNASPEGLNRVWESLRSQGFYSSESVHRRKDGSEFPVEIVTTYVQFGGREYSCGFARDITERKKAVESLRESEDGLAAAQRIAHIGSWDWNIKTDTANWSDETFRIFGLPPGQLERYRQAFLELIHPADRMRVESAMAGALNGTREYDIEYRIQLGDGTEKVIHSQGEILKDEAGSPFAIRGTDHDITERKRVEEALCKSEENYRSLVSNIPDVAWTVNSDLRFVFISKNIERVSGFSPDEVYVQGAQIYLSSLHPDDVHKVREGFRALFAEGRPFDVEVRAQRKNGEWIWVHDRALATYEKNGIRYADGLLSDITERKRAEEELYQSRQLLQSILDTIPQRVFWKDRSISYLGCNKAFAIDAGLKDPADIMGKNDYDLAWKETAELYRADDKLVMEQETPRLNFDEPQSRPDGSLWWLRTSKLPLRDQQGRVIGVLGTYEDITERKQAEAEHVRLVTAIEQSAEAVVITDPAGSIEYVNPAFTSMTGYSREEVLGKNPRVLKSGKHEPEFYRELWQTILNGQPWHGELVNQRKDGSLYMEEMTITPVRDEHGKVTHFIAGKQDVSVRKTLEAQLHQAAKMEAVGRLAGGVAHDFNNLLTVINGYSEILLEKLASDPKSSVYLREINDAGGRAASLTRQLLAFSRLQVLTPQVLDLNAVVSNLEKMLRRLIGEDIELHTLLDPHLERVKADPGQIEQVIMNLAVNARDAMPKGGHLTLETRAVELDEDYARNHPTVTPGPHVMLAVGDTGVGMTPETKARIFEPFFTTKEQGKGTGLGLATVYGIVKQSGGSIWVYTELGRGTVFKIYLPMVSESLMPRGQAKAETNSASGTETILVVEDEEAVRSLVRLALVSGGYKVLEAPDPESALATCASHHGPIHLLLTDVVMPQISGPEVASKVAALRPGIRVLYMSGYTDDAVVHHGVLSQEMPFIQKPFSPVVLRKKIREVLGKK